MSIRLSVFPSVCLSVYPPKFLNFKFFINICRIEWIAQVRVCKLSKIRSRRWPRSAASCALHPSGPAGGWCTCIHASTLVLLYICILWAGGVFWRYTFTLEYLYDCFFSCQWLASPADLTALLVRHRFHLGPATSCHSTWLTCLRRTKISICHWSFYL